MKRLDGHHARESRHLPPVSLRANGFEDPNKTTFDRLPTPLNNIGLVDKPKLIKLVRGTLNSAYAWPSVLDDEHHCQWPRRNYVDRPDEKINPYEFRNFALNKMYWPRMFHAWAHKVTEQPPVPSLEVMHNVGQAQFAIDTLHRSVQIAKMLNRNKNISPKSLNGRLEELYEEYNESLDDLNQLDTEFHFLDINQIRPESIHDLLNIKGELGRLATVPTVATTTRHIRQPTHRQAPSIAA